MIPPRKPFHLTLFKKLFVLLFLSTSLPVSVLGYLYFDKSGEQIEKVTDSLLQENLQQNKARLDRFFAEVVEHSNQIIGSRKMETLLIGQDDPENRDPIFLGKAIRLKDELSGPYNLSVYPPSLDRYESYSRLQAPDADGLDSAWLAKAIELNGRESWSREGDQFVFVRLIRQMSDLRHLGVIRIVIPVDELYALLVAPLGYRNFTMYLTQAEEGQADGSAVAASRDFVASIPLAMEPWQLAASIPKEELIGPVQAIKWFSVLFVSVCILLISSLLVLITGSFVGPIRHIVGQMKRAQMGQLKPTSEYVGRRDEIGQLIRSYNALIAGMKELIGMIRQAESEKSRMEMQLLIHQINPHFLYNTLDAIKWKAHHVREESISDMVTSLSNILRYSINNGEEFTTLEREIEHVKSYLKVELLRHNDSFQTVFQVQPRLLNASILKLILQPIVENAVRHGIGKLPAGQGKILVRIYMEDNDLVLAVEDNGLGWPEAEQSAWKAQRPPSSAGTGGIGLFNVQRRLQSKFGVRYGLTVMQQPSGGCHVQIRHPHL